MDEKWVRECLRKKRLTKEYAEKVIARNNFPLYKYKCENCGTWHLTKTEHFRGRYQILNVV